MQVPLDSVSSPVQTETCNGDSSPPPSPFLEANGVEAQNDTRSRTISLLRRLAFVVSLAILGCEVPAVVFPIWGEAALSDTRLASVGEALKTATVGSLIVGSATGLAWFALFQCLKQRRGEEESDENRRLTILRYTFGFTQPTVVSVAAWAVGAALVRPGGTSVRDALVIYAAGTGRFAMFLVVGGLVIGVIHYASSS
ncbi:hypothetical protein VTO73DRAFT_9096 [Trametes versicolor]